MLSQEFVSQMVDAKAAVEWLREMGFDTSSEADDVSEQNPEPPPHRDSEAFVDNGDGDSTSEADGLSR